MTEGVWIAALCSQRLKRRFWLWIISSCRALPALFAMNTSNPEKKVQVMRKKMYTVFCHFKFRHCEPLAAKQSKERIQAMKEKILREIRLLIIKTVKEMRTVFCYSHMNIYAAFSHCKLLKFYHEPLQILRHCETQRKNPNRKEYAR
jgi:uncharacterized membrane protein YhfC